MLYTYKDALDFAMDYLGEASGDYDRRTSIRAIQDAYRELVNIHDWTYYTAQFRIPTVAPYRTGTVAYTHSTRTLTLTSGTWPTWAALGTVIIDNVQYQVATRTSGSAVVLSLTSNPGEDVDAGTSYTIYQALYPLPSDLISMDQLSAMGTLQSCPSYVRATDWLQPQHLNQQPNIPAFYTIMGSPDYLNRLSVAFSPPPNGVFHYDAVCKRRARPLRLIEYSTGTITNSADSSTITGSGTAWTEAKHAGAVIRFSEDGTNLPTDDAGLNPADEERIVGAVGSTTSITTDAALDNAHTAVKYLISDPVDIENGAMLAAFQRLISLKLCQARRIKDVPVADAAWWQAFKEAQEADSRSTARRSVMGRSYPMDIDDSPIGADVEAP